MPLAVQNLWCQVFGSSAETVCASITAADSLLRESKIGQTNVALGVKEDVLWFQISINYVKAVDVADCKDDFSCVETRSVLWEFTEFPQMKKELAARAVIQNKIQLCLGLKGHSHPNNERMADITQHVAFCLGMLHLISFYDIVLLQNFQCVHLACLDLTNKEHFAKRSLADYFDHFERIETGRRFWHCLVETSTEGRSCIFHGTSDSSSPHPRYSSSHLQSIMMLVLMEAV
mmetsp:Transcript_76481/g.222133  ORF Transcript_76481/g.222133 Transcript_76481/m.222133 type:complete len:232 (-) Transcript_76481:507-1202(-)